MTRTTTQAAVGTAAESAKDSVRFFTISGLAARLFATVRKTEGCSVDIKYKKQSDCSEEDRNSRGKLITIPQQRVLLYQQDMEELVQKKTRFLLRRFNKEWAGTDNDFFTYL